MLAIGGAINPLGIIRNLNINLRTQSDAMTRLSSGLRINKASDDPSGLTLSEQLRSQIEGLERAIQNTETSDDMLAAMDGSLGIVQGVLNTMRGLAVSAVNTGVSSPEQIARLQAEMDSSLQSIERIMNSTSTGGRMLIDNLIDEGKLTMGRINPDDPGTGGGAEPSADGKGGDGANGAGAAAAAAGAKGRDWVDELLQGGQGGGGGVPSDAILSLNPDPDGDGVPVGTTEEAEQLLREIAQLSDKDRAIYDLGNAFGDFGLKSLGEITLPGGLGGVLPQKTLTLQDVYSGGAASLTKDPATAMRIIEQAGRDNRNKRAQIGAAMSMRANEAAAMETNLENLRRTESGIRDTEYAETMTELVRSQIVSQAGFKMLDAAMEQNRSVLELLTFS